jgi:serine protease Do
VIDMGVSSDLMPGESVIAVGNAFGYEHTVTCGIVSALHREVQVSATQKYRDLIQTDASINPGNSGGPLLNIDGQMIGVNVAVRVGAQGIGFAIPVDEALDIAARLLNVERIDQTTHGVIGESRHRRRGGSFVVTALKPESPAQQAGLQAGT